MEKRKDRNKILDLVKGIAIFLMVWGHCISALAPNSISFYNNFTYKFIYSFHMPLFMLVSGYLFEKTANKYNFKEIIKKKTRTLLVPALLFGLIHYLFCNKISSSNSILQFITGVTCFWFLIATFISSMIFACVKKYFHDSNVIYILLCISCFFIPFGAPYLFLFQFFFLGYIYSKYKMNFIDRKTKIVFMISTLLYIFLIPYYSNDTYVYVSGMNILNRKYDNMLLMCIYRLVIAIVGSLSVISFCKIISNKIEKSYFLKKIIDVGKNTIYIYVISTFLITFGLGKSLAFFIIAKDNLVLTSIYYLPISIILVIFAWQISKLLLKIDLWKIIFGIEKETK